jgi:hypothetical protein
MKKKTSVILVVILLVIIIGMIWWYKPVFFLQGVNSGDVAYIIIANGTNGDELTIEDASDISYIIDNIQNIPMKKEKISMTYAGTGIRLAFYTNDGKKIDEFSVNYYDTIRKDPFFYTDKTGSLCVNYLRELEDSLTDSVIDPLQDLKNYISVAEGPAEVKEYLDTLMGVIGEAAVPDTETADVLVLEYLNYLGEILMQDQNDLSDYPEKAGFKLNAGEGGDYPVIDYRFINAYSDQVSQEITDFAGFMALDSDKPWAIDAGIIVPIRELADRTARAEQFMTAYPDSVLKDQVLFLYERYLGAFLAGLPNTPLYPFETYKAEDKFLDAYDYFIETYPDLITAETVRLYQAELEQMNYTAPYTYSDSEKRAAFSDHIYELVKSTIDRLR